jgi:sugar lactone lactonase YvrE
VAFAAIVSLTAPLHSQSVYTSPYTFTTLAGTAGTHGNADGAGTAAQFFSPTYVAVDASGTLYVSDTGNDSIRKVTAAGVVSTLAGGPGQFGFGGYADGTGLAALFASPLGIGVDQSGNVFVCDLYNYVIRKITPAGVVSTFAGNYADGKAGVEAADGTGSGADFDFVNGLAIDSNGNLFVADDPALIREVTPGAVVTTIAGTDHVSGSLDGQGLNAMFDHPGGVAVDANADLYIADTANNIIRKIAPGGFVTTLAGKAGVTGSADGTGGAASFNAPFGIAVDGNGNVFVGDSGNGVVRMITPAGVVTTIAGKAGVKGSTDGTGVAALFSSPYGVAFDTSGNLYVTDSVTHVIRKGSIGGSPQIQAQPTGQYVAEGGSATFTVMASGSGGLTYQWNFNGTPIAGATGSSYTIASVQASDAGTYTVTITDSNGSVTSGGASLTINSGVATARLINISTRAQVGTGGNILIPGFAIAGPGTETLLIRGDGPSLAQFSVPGVLAQPSLSVYDSGGHLIATNTGWGTNTNPAQIASVAAQVGAFALTSGSADCALVANLTAGSYTVQISGVNGTTGVALAEVYEVSSTGTRIVNISTRAQVGTGGNILIPGFVISGPGNEELLVRGDGPSLTQFGVPGVLAQPALGVYNSATALIASNTVWGTASNPAQIVAVAASVGAFAFVSGSADSALIANLTAGTYTIQVSGVNNTTGVALAEVYEVP